ncbi:MAG TPA: right-handed parallel beta-helix repeat-containing protein [Thermoanaerobaculia bacterium]|jgi:hypothetical protein
MAASITGGVYEDAPALALPENFTPAAGVSVALYSENGTLRLQSATDAAGRYRFEVAPGSYWIAVDAKTFRRATTSLPEQSYGPAGAVCAQPDGTTRSNFFAGACVAGRTVDGADDASSLNTSEHVAKIDVREDVRGVDFGFSFNLVTTRRDVRTQGSLRQFVENANALPGGNRMRFVPVRLAAPQRETSYGAPPRWWSIALASPLPELTDADTTIDGTPYSFVSPDSPLNPNPGLIDEPATIRPDQRFGRQERPDLELITSGERGIVCAARCIIRAIAIYGSPVSLVLRSDARLEHVLVGARADGTGIDRRGSVGIQIERGTTTARDVYVTEQSNAGIATATAEGKLDGERIDVRRCGEAAAGGGIILFSDGSVVRGSQVMENRGAGVIIGSADGKLAARANVIDSSTISSNWAGVLLSPAASGNAITRNAIMWNRVGGVVLAPYQTTVPQENRVSANRYNENGNRPIVLDLTAPPNVLAIPKQTCDRPADAPNRGMTAPEIRSVRLVRNDNGLARVIITGRACPGETVELYQSFVTSSVRDTAREQSTVIRSNETADRETLTAEGRRLSLPSIGEFNYAGATSTGPDGIFEAAFQITVRDEDRDREDDDTEEVSIWADEILRKGDVTDRAFSAIAIDAAGNTSEMSARRAID